MKGKIVGKRTGIQVKLIAMEREYIFDPIVSIPTGHACAATMDPMDVPEAEKFRPRARTAVGKI